MKKKKLGILFLIGIFLLPITTNAYEKKETIYTNLYADGSVSKMSVTNHLSNLDSGKVKDETLLKDILNINGKEKFTLKDGNLLWNSKGEDIFYQGYMDKKLPIQTKITYFLNDKEMNVKDIVGKKGTVKIVYSFTNLEQKNTFVNGKNTTLYTPFVVTLGTILDSEKNKNVSITNGKVVNTGTKSMVVAVASPGLYESTSLRSFKTMDTIEIEYDTKSFALGNVYLAVTPKLLEDNDFTVFTKMDNLYGKMDTLQASMNQINIGVEKLVDGSSKLFSSTNVISQNLETVKGAIDRLQAGSVSLDDGLKGLIYALQNVQSSIQNADLAGSMQNLAILKNENNKAIQNILTSSSQTFESLSRLYEANNLKDYTGTDATLLSLKSSYEMVFLLMQNNGAIDKTISTMTSFSNQIESMLTTLNASLVQLENGANTLVNGLGQVQSGVHQLYNGSLALTSGTKELHMGAATLLTGTNTFNKEGIGSLSKVTHEAKNYSNTARKLVQLSEEYTGFSSTNSKSTLFVYMIESVK